MQFDISQAKKDLVTLISDMAAQTRGVRRAYQAALVEEQWKVQKDDREALYRKRLGYKDQQEPDLNLMPLEEVRRASEGLVRDAVKMLVDNMLFVPVDAPEVIGRGTKQLVLRLGHGAAAKAQVEQDIDPHYVDQQPVFEGHYRLVFPGRYNPVLFGVPDTLRQLGYRNVPDHHYVKVEKPARKYAVRDARSNERADMVITADLTHHQGDGPYEIHEVEGIEHCANADELAALLAQKLEHLGDVHREYMEKPKESPFVVDALYHADARGKGEKDPRGALQRMLLVRKHTETGIGSLVWADLNHVHLGVNQSTEQ